MRRQSVHPNAILRAQIFDDEIQIFAPDLGVAS